MREIFFNERGVRDLGARLRDANPSFDEDGFVREVLAKLPPLGLNERNAMIRDALRARMPDEFRAAVRILVASLAPPCAPGEPFPPGQFITMSLCAYVAEYGLHDLPASLAALREMTQRFSAEFAIRPFLDRHTDATLAELRTWADDPNPAVRRLVSEGTRPRLPWGMRLQRFVKDPRPVLALLEGLKSDPDEVVRRSVANNLNDIAKDHPDLVVSTLARWTREATPEMRRLARHALRTLLKRGHAGALALQGHAHGAKVRVSRFTLSSRRVRIGETLSFSFALTSTAKRAQALMIDYAVHYRKANGTQNPKVFKLKTLDLAAGATAILTKRQPFRPIGVRPFHPGPHAIELLVNGVSAGRRPFNLVAR